MASAVAAVTAVAAHTTGASFSAGTTNPSNTFSAASSWAGGCPNTTPLTDWIGGFETGRVFGGHASGIALAANAAAISATTTNARNGAYGMRLTATGGATYAQRLFNTNVQPVSVMRFAVQLQSLPSMDVELAKIGPSSGGQLAFGYNAATNAFTVQLGAGTAVDSTMPVSAGQWYVVDLRIDMSSASLWTADWRVDGVAQASRSLAAAGTGSFYAMWLGSTQSGDVYTAYYDDVAMTRAAADYPLGDGKVLALKPAGMGNSVNVGDFTNEDGQSVNAFVWQRVDDVPMSGSTDYVQQIFTGPTSYLEFRLEQTTETCIRMVEGHEMNNMGNSSQNNHGKTVLADGAVERTIFDGTMTAQAANAEYVKSAAIMPGGSRWTQTALNNAVLRVGYSTDASPVPRWDALLVEYEVAL